MVEPIDGFIVLQTFSTTPFSSTECTGKLFRKGFVLPQLLKHWLVSKIRNVLGIVEIRGRRRTFVSTFPMTRLPREDSYCGSVSILGGKRGVP